MFKTKLEAFLFKRVIIILVLAAVLDFLLMKDKIFILTGLIIGAVLSLLKVSSYIKVFMKIISPEAGKEQYKRGASKSIINFIVNQALVLVLLIVAFKINQWLFMGLVAGLLLTPLAIMINCFTEALKITHNNFE